MAVESQIKVYLTVFTCLVLALAVVPYAWVSVQLAGAFCILCMLARRITTEYNRQTGKTPVKSHDKVRACTQIAAGFSDRVSRKQFSRERPCRSRPTSLLSHSHGGDCRTVETLRFFSGFLLPGSLRYRLRFRFRLQSRQATGHARFPGEFERLLCIGWRLQQTGQGRCTDRVLR